MKVSVSMSYYDQSNRPQNQRYEGPAAKGGRISVDVALEGEEKQSDFVSLVGKIQKLVKGRVAPSAIKDSLDFLCYTGVVSEHNKRYLATGRLFRDWFVQHKREEIKIVDSPKRSESFNITRSYGDNSQSSSHFVCAQLEEGVT